MEALAAGADVVTEHAIFSALAPPLTAPMSASAALSMANTSMRTRDDAERDSERSPSSLPPVCKKTASAAQSETAGLLSPVRHIGSLSWLSPKTPRSLMTSIPITADECTAVWKFLCDWVQSQIAMEAPASIPRFGTVSLKVHALSIRIPHFEPEQSFLDAFGLQTEVHPTAALLPRTNSSSRMDAGSSSSSSGSSSAAGKNQCVPPSSAMFTFSYLEMAACCGPAIDTTKAQEWLQTVIQKIGQAMHQCKRVELNLGVGVISCTNRIVEHQMASRSTNASAPLEYEIRTGESVVKRNLSSLKASAPKPKASFLTSGDFSQAIQVNPVYDNSSAMPNFQFDLTQPRRPPPGSISRSRYSNNNNNRASSPQASLAKASPRSQQLQTRLQRSPGPMSSTHTNASTHASPSEHTSAETVTPFAGAPVLFDPLSRTLCVEPDQNVSFLRPSNRIATNYTPSAALLMMQTIVTASGSSVSTKSSVSGLVFYEEPDGNGNAVATSSHPRRDFPRTLEPGSLWTAATADSPNRSQRGQLTARRHQELGADSKDPRTSRSPLSGEPLHAPVHDAKSEERYFAFISGDDRLVERRWLTPISPELIHRIVASAVKYLTEPPSGHMQQILSASQDEFIANYYVSAKKAIVDYILLRAAARLRLGIAHGTPRHATLPVHWQWGNSDGSNGCLQDLKLLAARQHQQQQQAAKRFAARERARLRGINSVAHGADSTAASPYYALSDNKSRRRQRVKSKLSTLYMLSDPLVRTLQTLWHGLEPLLLVNLPSVDALSARSITPLDLHAFENEQLQHAARVRTHLMEHWYRRVRAMVEDAVYAETVAISVSTATAAEHRVRHLFDAISTLMSLQLRALIVRSVQAYVAFFELFGESASERAAVTAHHDEDTANASASEVPQNPSYSGLLLSLALQGADVQFRDSLLETPNHLLSVLHNLPQLFHNVSRIETQFTEPLLRVTPHTPFLWNVTSQEDELVLATIRIRDIVERNLSRLRQLQSDYAGFAHMYRHVCALDTHALAENSNIALCRAEMAQVRETAVRITTETHDRAHLGLFCVDCNHANTMLLAGFARWANALLLAFQEHTSRLNRELRHEYKDVAARLTKKPMDLYELVDAEEFVTYLKTTKIDQLHTKANMIKARIQFLLFERGSVRIEIPAGLDADAAAVDKERESEVTVQSTLPFASLSVDRGAGRLTLFRLSSDVLLSTAKTIKWQTHISRVLRGAEASLVNERARIETIFLAKRTRFQAEIEEFDGEVKGFSKKGDLRHAATYVVQLAKMKDTLFSFRKTMEAIIEEETKLQWKTTDFSKLDDIAEEMEPYEQLWRTTREFREMSSRWLRGNVFELEPSDGMQTLHQMLAVVASVSNLLHLNSVATAITAEMVKKQITDFRENARLVGAILNPSMKSRHLKEVAALIGVTLDPLEPVTLLKLLENGAFDHLGKILEISQNATQEKHVEDALAQIAAEWDDLRFEFKPAKAIAEGQVVSTVSATSATALSGTAASSVRAPVSECLPEPSSASPLLRACVEETQRVIEENQVRLQSLLCMQHAIPFAHEIASWLQFIHTVHRLVDALCEVGRAWKALGPLFAANVVAATSKEAKLFSTADRLYTDIVAHIQQQPRCRDIVPRIASNKAGEVGSPPPPSSQSSLPQSSSAARTAESILSDLRMCLELLDAAKENLRVGLDGKRASFARFCFLSDLELVSALSCRHPTTGAARIESRELWCHLAPCFPGIHAVQTTTAREITAAVSSVGEQFSLGSPIATASVEMTLWLGKVEIAMVTILQASIRASISDCTRKEFRKWCLLWPEQVLCVAIQHAWTQQCELASLQPMPDEVVTAWDAVVASLREKHESVVKELKAATHAHSKMALARVLLLLGHLQDVSSAVAQETRQHAVETSSAADDTTDRSPHAASTSAHDGRAQRDSLVWLAQPRIYHEDNTFAVKLVTAAPIPYGFEYLGNQSATFFLAPLTLRCFHAIAQAATVLSRGTLLEGAAGTGKSTIVGALAQTCGQPFARVECSNAPSFAFLLQFVQGAASCGAALAIESFELLQRAQASAVAQLCAHVMHTLAARQSQCSLLGHKVRIKRGCSFAALLNNNSNSMGGGSGCTRRTSWQQSQSQALDAQFFFKRLVVATPDIEIIVERLLQQRKFTHSHALAKLLVVVLRAVERGFALVHASSEYRVDALRARCLNLRLAKRVVARAVELSWRERASRACSQPPMLLMCTSDRVESAAAASGNIAPYDALDAHGVEKMEYRLVCLALRDELSATTPVAHLDVVDSLLRDVAANSFKRELHVAKSLRLGSHVALPLSAVSVAATETVAAGDALPLDPQEREPVTLEDAIEAVVRMTDTVWLAFGGAGFNQKLLQLLEAVKTHRAVIVSGDIQSGKTSLYRALARALTQLAAEQHNSPTSVQKQAGAPLADPLSPLFSTHEVVAPTRCVVLAPRALTLDHLLGTASEHFGNSLLANVMRDAKRFHEHACTQTWLVLDGDVDSSWTEKFVHLLEELQDDVPGCSKGLLLASGKRVLLPRCMRLVLECTQLTDASPAFISRVGVVNLGASTARGWRGMYAAWKTLREREFGALAVEIFDIIDALLDETLDASLDFVEATFQRGFPQLRLARCRSLLALFHSSVRQVWLKLSSMVSSKQRKTAVHCFYLQAIVWGVGSTSDSHERQLFHDFLRHLIIHGPHAAQSSLKRVLVLFFPSGSTGATEAPSSGTTLLTSGGAARAALNAAAAAKDMIYAFGFSVDYGLKWMRWAEYYDLWVQSQMSLNASSASDLRSGGDGSSDNSIASLANLVVPNGPMTAAICLTNQLLLANYPVLLDGPSDSGKSVCGATWLALNDAFAKAQAAAEASMHPSFRSTDSGSNSVDAVSATQFQQVFAGHSTSSADVLEQITMLLERPTRDRQAFKPSGATLSHEAHTADEQRRTTVLRPDQSATGSARKRMSFVFIDDLHCVDTEACSGSALELLRMLVEHHQLMHPSLHQVVSCDNILPFASMQASAVFASARARRDVMRLTSRFVRVALPLLTDAELTSICAAIVPSLSGVTTAVMSSATTSAHLPVAAATVTGGDAGSGGGSQEAQQLVSVVIKASIKLFLFLSTEFALDTTKTPFDTRKLHYVFRVHEVLDVVRSVCCNAKPTLLTFADKPQLARLWCHESARTFGDRLMDANESAILHQHVRDIALVGFALTPDAFFPPSVEPAVVKNSAQSHVWLASQLHFTFIGESSGAGFMDGYREVTEMHKVELSIERSMMAMYRANLGAESLEVVICEYVIQHVLRLTRLLRISGQHVLLLGARGAKMTTITRLAAFMCRKTPIVFSVPKHADATSNGIADPDSGFATWQRELKSAILRSVRRRDEHIVFIFKDTQLASLVYYDAIERFVSGARLSAAFVTYDDLDDQILATLREQAHQERDASRSSSSSSSKLLVPSALGSKASVLEYFFAKVREKFQMVVILSEPERHRSGASASGVDGSAGTFAHILWKTPQLLKTCAIDYFGDWTEPSLVTIALKCFALSSDVDKDRAVQLAHTAVQIYLSTQRCWRLCTQASQQQAARDSNGVTESRDNGGGAVAATASSSKSLLQGTPPQLRLRDCVPPMQLDPSLLINQIGLFVKFAGKLQCKVAARKALFESGLAFLDESERILATEHAQTHVLQPEMRKRAELTRRMSGTLEKEKLTSDKLHRALELAVHLRDAQRQRLAQVEAEYHELVKESMAAFHSVQAKIAVFQIAKAEEMPHIDDAHSHEAQSSVAVADSVQHDSSADSNALGTDDEPHGVDAVPVSGTNDAAGVDSVTVASVSSAEPRSPEQGAEDGNLTLQQHRRALIKSFAAIKPTPTALKQLAECLGLIFGIAPVEARDELDPDEVFMDYWESVTARLKTLTFWDELLAYDMEARVNDKVLARVLPICTSPDFDVALFASLHELGVYLCEWVQAWASFARDIILAGPKFSQLVQEREAFTTARRSVSARKLELVAQHATSVEANALRHVSELERQDIEARLQENASTLQMATSVWKVLASSRTKWRAAYEYYTAFSAQWLGDLMLGTSVVAYASCASARVCVYLRAQWSTELRKQCLIHSPSRALHELFLVDDVQLSRWHLDGLPRGDVSTVENAAVVTHSYRFPLLVDPFGVATEWIKKQEAANKLEVVNCASVFAAAAGGGGGGGVWKQLEIAAKKQQTLMLTNFNEESALQLRALLGAKRRSLFEAVNRDISLLSGAGAGSNTGASSVARFAGDDSGATNYLCWFQVPLGKNRVDTDSASTPAMTPQQQQQSLLKATIGDLSSSSPSPIVEFGSETWRVYFVYSRTDSVPDWMLPLTNQLAIVRFAFSAAVVEAQSLSRIVGAHGKQHLLTEIQTLRSEILLCQEQVNAMEHEVLDFFSTERPELVYADVSKALRVIGNRSALHTLESSRTDLEHKVLANLAALERFRVLVDRSVDVALVWHDTALAMTLETPQQCGEPDDLFALSWVWVLLAQSLKQCAPQASLEHMARIYTDNVRALATAALSDENRVVFEFALAMRLYARARARWLTPASVVDDVDSAGNEAAVALNTREPASGHCDSEALYRALQIAQCDDASQLRQLCATAPAKLVALRPNAISPQKWRALCYVADAAPELQELMLQLADAKLRSTGDIDEWRRLAHWNVAQAQNSCSARPLAQLSALLRLCVVSVVHRELLLAEIERFSSSGEAVDADAHAASEPLETYAISADLEVAESGQEQQAGATAGHSSPPLPLPLSSAAHKRLLSSRSSHTADTLFDLWHDFSSARVPIVVTCTPDVNFLRHIECVALKAKMTIDPLTLHDNVLASSSSNADNDTSDDVFERALLAAMRKGHWVVFANAHTTPARLVYLQRMYETLDDQQLHSDFRLWVSSPATPMTPHWSSSSSSSRLCSDAADESRVAIAKQSVHVQQCGGFVLRRTLQHVFQVLTDDAQSRELVASCESLPKRVGLLHALLSTCDHLGFAHWKMGVAAPPTAFGDGHLRAMIDALWHMLSAAPPSSTESLDMAALYQACRASAANIYSVSLQTRHDQALLGCCLDLMFTPPRRSQGDADEHELSVAAVQTIPEVVVMVEHVDALSWESIVASGIRSLWCSDEVGPDISSLRDAALSTRAIQAPDVHQLRSRRQKRVVDKLTLLLEDSGAVVRLQPRSGALTTHALASEGLQTAVLWSVDMSRAPSPIEALLKLALDLESVAVNERELALRAPSEYKKPLQQLIRRELETLNGVRVAILSDIRRLQAVHIGAQQVDPSTWMQFVEAKRGFAPASWLQHMMVSPMYAQSSMPPLRSACSLSSFQHVLTERVKLLNSWLDADLPGMLLSVDAFQSTECVLESIHQHFIRNYVGDRLCESHCVRVVSVMEDRGQAALPHRDDSVFLRGFRVLGLLQLEVARAKVPSDRKRSAMPFASSSLPSAAASQSEACEIRPEGVPAILEVSSACMMTTASTLPLRLSPPSTPRRVSGTSHGRCESASAESPRQPPTAFLCPIYRCATPAREPPALLETEICVMTTLSHAALVLSGSGLCIDLFRGI